MASPPVVMLAPAVRLSVCSTSTLATEITVIAETRVMKPAYWPRLASTSLVMSPLPSLLNRRTTRVKRLSRASRSSAVILSTPRLGIEPSRSSQPRPWKK